MLSRRDFLASAGATSVGASLRSLGTGATRPNRRMRMGVNYVPSQMWWYVWSNWDIDSVRRDLHDIASLGLDHIRIQLLWPEFQPNASTTSAQNIARLVRLLDEAAAVNLDVEVTVLDGQLSGFLFVPPYLIDNQNGRVHNFITDPALIEAQQRLFTALAASITGHPRFMGFDIANEIYWFTQPLQVNFTPAQGDAWMNALLEHCARVAPGKFHVNGVDKWPYEANEASGFTRGALARAGSASVVHPWAGFGDIFPRYGPLSIAATHYAEFLVQYMQAFSDDGARTIWIEEDGCSKQWMREDLIPAWAEASIRNVAGCDHVFAFTWWCSHDVSERFSGFNKLEYDLGLFTNDRHIKPVGRMLRRLISEFDATPPAIKRRPKGMVVADKAGSNSILTRYMGLVREGIHPQIVLESRSRDRAYLMSRRIEELLT
jgi:hypothetical protein